MSSIENQLPFRGICPLRLSPESSMPSLRCAPFRLLITNPNKSRNETKWYDGTPFLEKGIKLSGESLTFLLVLFLLSLLACGCDIHIPTPNVAKKEWKSLEMNYGFVRGEGDIIERSFVISGADLDSLQRRFNPKFQGMSVGSSATSKLTLECGEVWLFMVITPQNMRLCLESNRKHHYAIKFDDLQFYDALRELCWKNELAIVPDVKIENIFLGYNGVHMHLDERPLVKPYQDEVVQ